MHSIPTAPDWDDPWTILLGNGTLDFLALEPFGNDTGTYYWTDDLSLGEDTALLNFVSLTWRTQ